jgi:hypothetical protein
MTKVIHYFELPNKNVKKNKLFSDAQKKPRDEQGLKLNLDEKRCKYTIISIQTKKKSSANYSFLDRFIF